MPLRKNVPILSLTNDQTEASPLVVSKPRRRPPVRKKKVGNPVLVREEKPKFTIQEAEELEFNPSPKFYKKIAITFLGLAFLLVLFVLFFISGSAKISLILKPKYIKIDTTLSVVPQAKENKQISGNVTQLILQEERNFLVSGGSNPIVGTAVGKAIIYNKRSVPQSLVATTRLLSPSNILFRLKKGVNIPANSQIEAEVYADKSGAESEISPTKFTIPGLSLDLQKLVYAESKDKMVGGVKYSKVLTEEDIKNAVAILTNDLFQQGQEKLKSATSTSANYTGSVFKYFQESFKNDSQVGSAVENFKVAVTLKIVGVVYDEAEINKYLSEQMRDNLIDHEVLSGMPEKPIIEISNYDNAKKTAELHLTQSALAKVSYLEDVVEKENILGKKKEQVLEYFKSLPWVEKVEVKISPGWFKKVPNEMSKVKIIIEQ